MNPFPTLDDDFFRPANPPNSSSQPPAGPQTGSFAPPPLPGRSNQPPNVPSRAGRPQSVSSALPKQAPSNFPPPQSGGPPPLPHRASMAPTSSNNISQQVTSSQSNAGTLAPPPIPSRPHGAAAAPPLPSRSNRAASVSAAPGKTPAPGPAKRPLPEPVAPVKPPPPLESHPAPLHDFNAPELPAIKLLTIEPAPAPQQPAQSKLKPPVPPREAPQAPRQIPIALTVTKRTPFFRDSSSKTPMCIPDRPAFNRMEQFAFAASSSPIVDSVSELAHHLSSLARDSFEKARAAFAWIASHIEFDANIWKESPDRDDPRVSPEEVLKSRKSTFIGFSNLFAALLKESGIEAIIIQGTTRLPGIALSRGSCRSAWNAFSVDEQWYLVDCCYANALVALREQQEQQKYSSFFFATFPEIFAQYNCPDDEKWQLIAEEMDRINPSDYGLLPEPQRPLPLPFRWLKPFPGPCIRTNGSMTFHMECSIAPQFHYTTPNFRSAQPITAQRAGPNRWTLTVTPAADWNYMGVLLQTSPTTIEPVSCFFAMNVSSQSTRDAYGPIGFYGLDPDAQKLRAPLVADAHRLQISRDIQAGKYDFVDMDQKARSCPEFATIEETVNYLTQISPSELGRTRVVFSWVASHIRYDYESYCSGSYATDLNGSSPEVVFQRRAGVCAGFSNLFFRMAVLSGLSPYVISGLAPGLSPGAALAPHMWNAILLEGEMFLLDCTWAAGALQNGAFRFNFEPFWFFTPPYQFVRSHFPNNPLWQLLEQPWSMSRFARRGPMLMPAVYASDMEITEPTTSKLQSQTTVTVTVRLGIPGKIKQLAMWFTRSGMANNIGQPKFFNKVSPAEFVLRDVRIEAPAGGSLIIGSADDSGQIQGAAVFSIC